MRRRNSPRKASKSVTKRLAVTFEQVRLAALAFARISWIVRF
jgi:hypothetical protein